MLSCACLLAPLLGPVSASGATVWREGAWLLDCRPMLGGFDCELRLAAPAAAARVSLRRDRLEGDVEIAVFEVRRDLPPDAGESFAWRLPDGQGGEGRLSVLGVSLAVMRLSAEALRGLPAQGEMEMAGARVPFVWRLPLAGLAEGLSRLRVCGEEG